MAAITELCEQLDVGGALDTAVGSIKQRDRGHSAGQLLVGLAAAQLTGEDHLVGLNRHRADAASQALTPVAGLCSTTAAGLARRITDGQSTQVETGVAAVSTRMLARLPAPRRAALLAAVTIDLDTTDVEVYGRRKQAVAYNYQGQRCGRPHVATWAEADVALAADLSAGNTDPRRGAPALLRRALAALPKGVGRIQLRADAGYFAVDMPHAQVTVADYRPAWWPTDTRLLIRRVHLDCDQISTDPRARRRRTLHPDQRTLPLDELAQTDAVYGYSFILTNLDVSTPDKAAAVEHWYRHRTEIENIRDAKHGAALRHLPPGYAHVNRAWMWGALIATSLAGWLHQLTADPDPGGGLLGWGVRDGKTMIATLRHRLIRVPGRLIHHAGQLILRLPPGHHLLNEVLTRLRALPATS